MLFSLIGLSDRPGATMVDAVERGAVARRLDADALAFDLERDRIAGMGCGGRCEEERGGGDGELVHDNLRNGVGPVWTEVGRGPGVVRP